MIPNTCANGIRILISSVDTNVLAGTSELPIAEYCKPISEPEEIDFELIRGLLDYALNKNANEDFADIFELDQWLAPRLHSGLRISRRLAGDKGFWTFVVLTVGRRYTWQRWSEDNLRPTMYRYTGDFKRNALARLWWFSEMTRNGSNYGPVNDVLRDASTAQFAMELRYSMYRPAVIAFGKVARMHNLNSLEVKDLSKRINAYLSLRVLEALGLDEHYDHRDAQWWNERPTLAELVAKEPIGPNDGTASQQAIDDLTAWFSGLVSERRNAVAS